MRAHARLLRRPEKSVVGIFVLVVILLQVIVPGASVSLSQVLARASVTGLVAAGLTCVIIEGGFDLSVGSTLALGAIVALKAPGGIYVGLIAALAAGVAVGIVNGLLVALFRINSLIATIATLTALRGLDYLITNSNPIQGTDVQGAISFVSPIFWILTPEILLFLVAVFVIHIFLARSRVGRDFYAVGGNKEAARAAGTPVRWRLIQGFIISGTFAALAGWSSAVQLDSANPNQGAEVTLLAITAAVIGGVSLKGGSGTALGTALGALLLAWIGTSFDVQGLSVTYRDVTYGSILLLVVVAEQVSAVSLALRRYGGRALRLLPRREAAPS